MKEKIITSFGMTFISFLSLFLLSCNNESANAIKNLEGSIPRPTALGTILGVSEVNDNDSVGAKFYFLGSETAHVDVMNQNEEIAVQRICEVLSDSIFHDLLSALVNERKGADIYIKGVTAADENALQEGNFYISPKMMEYIRTGEMNRELIAAQYALAYWSYLWKNERTFDKEDLNPSQIFIKEKTICWDYDFDDTVLPENKLKGLLMDDSRNQNILKSLLRGMNNISILSFLSNNGYNIKFIINNINKDTNFDIPISNSRFKNLVSELEQE